MQREKGQGWGFPSLAHWAVGEGGKLPHGGPLQASAGGGQCQARVCVPLPPPASQRGQQLVRGKDWGFPRLALWAAGRGKDPSHPPHTVQALDGRVECWVRIHSFPPPQTGGWLARGRDWGEIFCRLFPSLQLTAGGRGMCPAASQSWTANWLDSAAFIRVQHNWSHV